MVLELLLLFLLLLFLLLLLLLLLLSLLLLLAAAAAAVAVVVVVAVAAAAAYSRAKRDTRDTKRERAGGFFCYLLFPIACFLYTLLPSSRDTWELLGQILIKRNIRY